MERRERRALGQKRDLERSDIERGKQALPPFYINHRIKNR